MSSAARRNTILKKQQAQNDYVTAEVRLSFVSRTSFEGLLWNGRPAGKSGFQKSRTSGTHRLVAVFGANSLALIGLTTSPVLATVSLPVSLIDFGGWQPFSLQAW